MNPAKTDICKECGRGCEEPCLAIEKLYEIYEERRARQKQYLIKMLRPQLNLMDWEVAPDLQELGETIINRFPQFIFIKEFNIKIGYVRAYENKSAKGRAVFADCRKITSSYQAYLPYDFLITFYDPCVAILTTNQKKLVMYHELRHIEMTQKGFGVRPHDIEDFEEILQSFGLKWNAFGNDVPDILGKIDSVGGGDGKETGKQKAKKNKGQKASKG